MSDTTSPTADRPAPRTIDTVVTFLVMERPPRLRFMPPVNRKLALLHVEAPTVAYYRFLYDTVGRDYHWVDRKKLSDEVLAAEIAAPGVALYVAHVAGCPAGYFELDGRRTDEVWLAYFGIMPEFQGMGIGKWLLSEAIDAAWALAPKQVKVETCTLDDARALPLYQRFGFVPYERKAKTMELI